VLGTAAVFVAGVMLAAFSPSYGVLVAARVVIGLAVGSASMIVPLYIGEVVPPRIRGAMVSFNLLDRAGRRPLLLGGTTGMAAGMIVVALTFAIGGSQLHGGTAYIAIAGLLLYTGSFAIGLGPVFWLLISEIYPVENPRSGDERGHHGELGRKFRGHHLLPHPAERHRQCRDLLPVRWLVYRCAAYFQRQVPETKNRSLQDIERDLDLPARRDGASSGRFRVRT